MAGRFGIFWTKRARSERIEPCCVELSNPRADTFACAARTAGRAKKTTEMFASPSPVFSQLVMGVGLQGSQTPSPVPPPLAGFCF